MLSLLTDHRLSGSAYRRGTASARGSRPPIATRNSSTTPAPPRRGFLHQSGSESASSVQPRPCADRRPTSGRLRERRAAQYANLAVAETHYAWFTTRVRRCKWLAQPGTGLARRIAVFKGGHGNRLMEGKSSHAVAFRRRRHADAHCSALRRNDPGRQFSVVDARGSSKSRALLRRATAERLPRLNA